MEPRQQLVKLQGHHQLRNRLVLSLLSGKPVRIDQIRPDADEPGLKDYEVVLLRLLEMISNGTTVRISHTGTQVTFLPGTLINGSVELDIPPTRPVGYYLEALVALAPFGKKPLSCTLRGGITGSDHRGDLTPDTIRTATLPFLAAAYGLDAGGLEVQVKARGSAPLGGCDVRLIVQPALRLHPARLLDQGRVLKIRGIAACTRVAPAMATRLANAARSKLTRYIPDVYVYADAARKDTAGLSPGFAVSLVAESTTGVRYIAEVASRPRVADPETGEEIRAAVNDPEVLATQCSRALLEAIATGGCVDVAHEWLAMVFATVCSDEVSKWKQARRGEHGVDAFTIQALRDIDAFFNVQFKVSETKDGFISLSGVGAGFNSIHRKFT
ncbi:putative RNA-3'-phosphate cyclase [Catenaria anguillulae PL171]|uniref:Putative RNA-3'-phosphate cyclase n=1 Tax=Catenaria anguillulae PL171 TaxID=765915 RepID=A0A1Y2HI94_9FUNG|nr:putative RNA-3'-phosphate cyclase [Catenaria anguillulae PL171]